MTLFDDEGYANFPIPMTYQARLGLLIAAGIIDEQTIDMNRMSWLKDALENPENFKRKSDRLVVRWKRGKAVLEPLEGQKIEEILTLFLQNEGGILLDAIDLGRHLPHFDKKKSNSEYLLKRVTLDSYRADYHWQDALPMNGEDYATLLAWDLGIVVQVFQTLVHQNAQTGAENTSRPNYVNPYFYPNETSEKQCTGVDICLRPHVTFGPELLINPGVIQCLDDIILTLSNDLGWVFEERMPGYDRDLAIVFQSLSRSDIAKLEQDAETAHWIEASDMPLRLGTPGKLRELQSETVLAAALLNMPTDADQLSFAAKTRFLAIAWLVLHEDAHFSCGHIALDDGRSPLFDEFQSPAGRLGRDPFNEGWLHLTHIMELQADARAASTFFQMFQVSFLNSKVVDRKIASRAKRFVCESMLALCCTMLMAECQNELADRLDAGTKYVTHPPVSLRLFSLFIHLRGRRADTAHGHLFPEEKALGGIYEDYSQDDFRSLIITVYDWLEKSRVRLGLVSEERKLTEGAIAQIALDIVGICDGYNDVPGVENNDVPGDRPYEPKTALAKKYALYCEAYRNKLVEPLAALNLSGAVNSEFGRNLASVGFHDTSIQWPGLAPERIARLIGQVEAF